MIKSLPGISGLFTKIDTNYSDYKGRYCQNKGGNHQIACLT